MQLLMSAFSVIRFLIVHQLIISTTIATVTAAVSAADGVFTAMADMESLVPTVYHVANRLNEYIKAEESKLQRLRWFLEQYESMYVEASNDVPKYLNNPINAYLLIKRLSSDLSQVESVMKQHHSNQRAFTQNVMNNRLANEDGMVFPSDDDLNGASVALTRLQDTYNLDTHALAQGEIRGKKYASPLTANDCFELGRQSYNNDDHLHSVLWLQEAMTKYEEEVEGNNNNNKTVALHNILEHLSFSTYKQGDIEEALRLTNQLLELVPLHQNALSNKTHYEDLLAEMKKQKEGINETTSAAAGASRDNHNKLGGQQHTSTRLNANFDKLIADKNMLEEYKKQMQVYTQLCRGDKVVIGPAANLRCRYSKGHHPFLLLQPVKVEQVSLEPLILVYHDVISDDEIDTIKKLAHPKFTRAGVYDPSKSEHSKAVNIIQNYRISKVAWLQGQDHQHVFKTVRRVGDVTGLEMKAAENLQVANYGIGGYYVPHFDFNYSGSGQTGGGGAHFGKDADDRIATWMFYMSDVEAGGATVFPAVGAVIPPQKGSAAFWYNLHPNGQGNLMTLHAACPVLIGSKWVSNEWIHEQGQEFTRPCNIPFQQFIN